MAKLTGNIEHFIFSIPGVSQELKVVGFSGSEEISTPFQYSIELACEDADLDFSSCINKPALLTLISEHDDIERHVHGIVMRMRHVRQTKRFAIFSVELVPQLALLTLRRNSRIYQNTAVPDIIKSILKDAKIGDDQYKLMFKVTYNPREYCVQYRETDLEFISRLMEEEGIYYYFEHSEEAHLLVITDNDYSSKPINTPSTLAFYSGTGTVAPEDTVPVFVCSEQVQSGAVTLRDFNFKKPALGLQSQHQAKQFADLEVYDYPGGYEMPDSGDKYAQIRLEALQAAAHEAEGESNCLRLLPGFLMTLEEHPRKKANQEYLLTQMTCEGRQPQVLQELASDEGTSYNNKFICIPSLVPYRTAHATVKPRIEGVQTAIVVGPAGEEIYVDEFSRVKVQFHWDREGKNNEKSSCWIRVSQTMAGSGWGAMFIPRIGQEVIVEFLEGDPHRPLITGCVYHGTNKPPYALPEHKTRSTIKSNSTKGGDGSNELRFEDKKGSEEVYVHAEKDQNLYTRNKRTEYVGDESHLNVKKDALAKLEADVHTDITGDDITKVGGGVHLKVAQDWQGKMGTRMAVDAGQEIHLKAGMTLVLESGTQISLKVGGNFIDINPGGVFIKGTMVMVNSGGSAGSGSGASPKAPKNAAKAEDSKGGTDKPITQKAAALKAARASSTPFCEICNS